ncbi:RagB/SusD family nutrient uptake outer membrane protein [Anaerorudis cellulosivorans]|uniref:RagB/SusD family nutrient uptake outer membrane protein n=1 Tax=Anaerorudis cellulosivorans TaxID=3397862 RepID=UPI002220DA41|nr:RagB/SusD family nutrient uptake outer membrane protein [Seramator thermalis]MCW1735054.1 RagB/SusD family nutrient uptake outer membrane protein [Seramator thermalis]
MEKINLYKILVLVSIICFVSGCDSNINLDPEGIITAEGYFKSAEDYEKALNALYSRLNVNAYDLWLDAVTDNGLVTHSWNRGYDLGRGIGNTFSSFPEEKWVNGYISIQRANNIINNIDKYEWPGGKNDIERSRVLGEAQTLRAYFYLDLVSIFGHIMFYTENPNSVVESEKVKQIENPKEVFDFILDELKAAIPELPEKAANKSKIGKPAARLLRARAAAYAAGYLNDKSYFQIVLEETEPLIVSAPPLADFSKLFVLGNEDLDEVILVRSYSPDALNYWGDWYNQSIGGFCVTTPVKALVDAFEYIGEKDEKMPYLNKDPRFYQTIYAPGMVLRGKYYNTIPDNVVEKNGKFYFDPNKDYGSLQDKEVMIGDVLGEGGGSEWNKTPTGFSWKKYFQEPETWYTYNSFIIFRYAEAYLFRAEALVETGGSSEEAKRLIKIIRNRAGNTNDIDKIVAEKYNGSLLDLIRNERRVELADEGLRFYDIRRWNILLDVMNKPIEGIEYRDFSFDPPKNVVYTPAIREPYSEKDFWWPIPQSEIDLNRGRIKQNDGWK